MASATSDYVSFVSDGFLFTSLVPPHDLSEDEERSVTLGGCIDIHISREAIFSNFETLFLKVCRYPCRVFTVIRRSLLVETGVDVRNRGQVEPLIAADLEMLLLTLALLRSAPISVTLRGTNPGTIPEGRQPLQIDRLLEPHPLYEGMDTEHKRGDIRHVPFHLVRAGGEGYTSFPLSDGDLPVQSVFGALSAAVDARNDAVARRLLGGLYYLRRALFLEAHSMYNEAFLAFYKIIELYLGRGQTEVDAAAAADALEAEAGKLRGGSAASNLEAIFNSLRRRLGTESLSARFDRFIDESGFLQMPGIENTVADKQRLMRLPARRSRIEAHAREDVWDEGEVGQLELAVCRWFAMYLLRRDLGFPPELQRALL